VGEAFVKVHLHRQKLTTLSQGENAINSDMAMLALVHRATPRH
jgi:hypothetical protein